MLSPRKGNLPKFDELPKDTRLQMVQRLWDNEDFQVLFQMHVEQEESTALKAMATVSEAELPFARWKWKEMGKLANRLKDMEKTLSELNA